MKRNVLLNPGPATTTDTVKRAQIVPDICPREREFGAIMQEVSDGLLSVVHGDPEKYAAVLFCGSGTISMEVCINSLLPEGKRILIADNGAYSSRAAAICEAYHLDFKDLRFPVEAPIDTDKVAEALAQDPDIAVVYTTHQETGTGVLNPIREIGALAHEVGAIFIVDTTSTFAMRPMELEGENIDFCMASAQKGIQAMTGLSFVIGRKKFIEASGEYPVRSYYCNLFQQYDYFQRTGQMRFTPPVQAIYAARQALLEYFEEGGQDKWKRHSRVMESIHEGLARLGFEEVIRREYQGGLVAAVKYPKDEKWDFDKVHDYCYERGFTIYPGKMQEQGTFRLCALGAIDERDIQQFFAVFEEALQRHGIGIPVK